MEIPEIVPDVTEYILGRRRCQFCDTVTTATLPEGTPHGMCGPRLSSLIVLLTGVYHLSRRNTAALLQGVLGVKLSLGSVSNVEGRMTAILGAAHDEALSCVRQARVKHPNVVAAPSHRRRWLAEIEHSFPDGPLPRTGLHRSIYAASPVPRSCLTAGERGTVSETRPRLYP